MKSDTVPHWTSDLQSFNSATLQLLQKSLNTSSSGDVCIFGGIGTSGKWGWLARNSNLEIIDTSDGSRTSAFCFGHATGNTDVSITCVKEYDIKGTSKLAVGLKLHNGEGMLCIYDPRVARVVMAVDIPHVVTVIEPVTSCGGVNAPNFALNEHLRCFFGIIAVGTKGGHIFLVDVCLDEEDDSDETTSKQIKVVTPRTQDVELLREKLIIKGDHIGQEINSNCHTFRSFNYDMPNGMTVKSLYPSEVSVTAMKYVSQIGSLAVGFNFGGFQLWKLAVPMIEYSSPLTQQAFPVTHFAYQEPEDDPQYFCYMWVGRGSLATDANQDVPSSLHLFQLSYDNKEVYPRYGHIYRDLTSCTARFQYDLTADTSQDVERADGCRLIACTTLAKDVAPGTRHEDSTLEEEDNHQDLSLASFVWEAPSDPADGQSRTTCYLGLFDLNRWYHAQLPLAISQRDMQQSCSYLAFYSLDSVMESASPDVLLDLHIDTAHISRYLSTVSPAPEAHFHPSALSFDITSLMETGIVTATYLGAQHQVLGDLAQMGPSILREPQIFYNRCWASGLLIKRQVLDQGLANLTPQAQREALLSIALDHNLIGFLTDCINTFTLGDFTTGCTLRTILDWAWSKVASIKQSVDQLCVQLYDGFGTSVDEQTIKQLDQHAVQMSHMITIFQSLLDQSPTTTEQGMRDLETKQCVVTLICQHLQVVLWFVKTELLPECADDMGETLEGQFCYPARRLHDVYTQRRAQLQTLCKGNSNGDILMIDGLVSQVGGSLTNLWAAKSSSGSGQYPPASLHALLDMYLLENIPLLAKHCIVGYLLLDIIFTLSDAKYEEMAKKIELFFQCFSLPLGVIKMLQGFWYLDHKDFDQAIEILVDPAVHGYIDASPWQHRNIIRAFLYYNESKRALQYIRTARPSFVNPEDTELHLTVLLANRLTGEAFEFQRRHRDMTTSEDLLHQLFLGSHQTKTMDELLKLPFDEEEEMALVKYLQESTESNAQELLVMHYLQRGRYVEAIRANKHLNQHSLMDIGGDPLHRERTCARNVIVDSYSKLLPGIQRKLAFGPESNMDRTKMIRREVVKPRPLSSVINPAKTKQMISHGLLVNAVLDRIAEAHVKLRQEETPTKAWPGNDDVEDSPPMEPFVGTPITPRTRTSRLSSSVVYPSSLVTNDSMAGYQASPMARTMPIMMPPMSAPQDKGNKPPIDYTGTYVLSLLQTPTITKKRTPSAIRPKLEMAMPPTPQSILKTRTKIARRSPGPSPVNQTAVPKVKPGQTKRVSMADMAMPTPPAFQKKHLSFAEDVTVKQEKKSATPVKRITFADETFGKAPSPEPKTTIHYPAASVSTPSPKETKASSPSTEPSAIRRSPSPRKGSPEKPIDPEHVLQSYLSPPKSDPSSSEFDVTPPKLASPMDTSAAGEPSPQKEASPYPPISPSLPMEIRDISPVKETSPPKQVSPPPVDQSLEVRETSPPRQVSPPRDISPSKSISPSKPVDDFPPRETPTPPFVSPASSPPRLSGSPTKDVSIAPVPTQVVPASPEGASRSETPEMYEQALMEQMIVDDEITFNLTKHEDDMEEEEEMEEDEAQPVEEASPSPPDEPDAAEIAEKSVQEESFHQEQSTDLNYERSPLARPSIHDRIASSSSPPSFPPMQQTEQTTPPRMHQEITFPTPPSASREPEASVYPPTDTSESVDSDVFVKPQRHPMSSTFAPDATTETRSFGVSPFVGKGAFNTQESIGTSPMTQSIFGLGASRSEMAAQTTPGLALRGEGGPSRPRTSFAASLQAIPQTPPPRDSGKKTEQDVDLAQEEATPREPRVRPQDESHTDGPSTRSRQQRVEQPEAPSFIFSPPQTRSRGRRQAHKNLSDITTPAFSTSKNSAFQMPSMGPTPSNAIRQTIISSTPRVSRRTSREVTPNVSLSVGGTPGATPMSEPKSAGTPRRSPRTRRKGVQSESTPVVSRSVEKQSLRSGKTTGGRVTRSRKSVMPTGQPSDSPVLLLSPVEPESDNNTTKTTRIRPKKVVRAAHKMTLRTPKKTTSKNVKLW